jgi:hypothetical protein
VSEIFASTVNTDYRLGDRGFESQLGQEICVLSKISIPALMLTEASVHWVWADSSPGVKWQAVWLATHLHLVRRLRMCGAVPSLPLYALIVCIGVVFLILFYLKVIRLSCLAKLHVW